jgi:ATP-dependent DNA helicase RecG
MKPPTDIQLAALARDLESDRVERKEAWAGSAPEKVREAVCAFANDLPNHQQPGVVFIGVCDNGTPANTPITDQLLCTLADIKTDGRIIPPPTLTVGKRQLNGHDVAVVCVWPADAPPVRFNGRIWIRIGPRRGLASAQDERILNERRRHRDIPYDLHPVPSASLADLSRSYFEEIYLPNAFAEDVLAANERTYEERLAACRMIVAANDPTPTVLGLLTLAQNPQFWLPGSYVQFLRIQGVEWSDPIIDEATIKGRLERIVERIDDITEAHNRIAIDITSAPQERRYFTYPPEALQQLARNAIMHRAYEGSNTPVRIYWFDDRIEIISPGGPFGDVTRENFGQPGVSSYRNPHVAEAMRVLNLVQRFGVGIAIAQASLRANGNPPATFQVEPSTIFARIFPKPAGPHTAN